MMTQASQYRILAAEDDVDIQALLGAVLESAGYVVEIAANGAIALSRLEDFRPHLILLDMAMPDMDGLEFLRRRSQMLAFRDLPVMMLSARDSNRDVLTAIEMGADAYMTKPFDPERLLSGIHNLLSEPPALAASA